MSPLVSIIIPAYNSEKWIEQTLRSALEQTWPHIEIIVIDDGSTDGTLKIAQGFSSDQLKVYTQENRGAAAARNRGLLAASGDFIQFLDADDLLDPRKIEIQVGRLLQEGNDCVASGSWTMFSGSIDGVTISPEPLWRDMGPVEWLRALFFRKGMIPIHAWLFPRKLLESAGPWDERLTLNDDREYSCRAVAHARKLLFCPTSISYYRRGISSSLSSTRSEAAWASAFLASELSVKALLGRDASKETRSACASEYLGLIFSLFPECPELRLHAEQSIAALHAGRVAPPFGGLLSRAAAFMLGWKTVLVIKYLLNRARGQTAWR